MFVEQKKFFFIVCGNAFTVYNKSTNRKDYKIRAINATLSAIWKDFLNLDFTNFKK